MKIIKDDIWKYDQEGYIIVTTNGFIKSNGECVMGAGIAQQAKIKYPKLPKELGTMIKQYGNVPFAFYGAHIITFPVKDVWWEKADLNLIEQSCIHLKLLLLKEVESTWKIYMPKVGCGNGQLDWKDVEPIIENHLPFVTIVDHK